MSSGDGHIQTDHSRKSAQPAWANSPCIMVKGVTVLVGGLCVVRSTNNCFRGDNEQCTWWSGWHARLPCARSQQVGRPHVHVFHMRPRGGVEATAQLHCRATVRASRGAENTETNTTFVGNVVRMYSENADSMC